MRKLFYVVPCLLLLAGCDGTAAQKAKDIGAGLQSAVVAAAPVVFRTMCDNYQNLDTIFRLTNTDPAKAADEQKAVISLSVACKNPPVDLKSIIADLVTGYMAVKLATPATASSLAPTVAVAPADPS